MLTLYLVFVKDAVRLTALAAAGYVALAAALLRFGFPVSVVDVTLPQLALVGLFFLAQRYTGKNLEWILGLPFRKTTLAWYNFALNLTLVVVAAAGVAAVMLATDLLAPETGAEAPLALRLPRLLALHQLHGRELAVGVFLVSAVLMSCWMVHRPTPTRDFAQRQRVLLFAWVAGVMGFVFVVTRTDGALSRALSPLLIFVVATAVACIAATYLAARTLGASVRQRRVWTLVGGAIALAEVLVLVAVTRADLRSGDPAIREQAARFFGIIELPFTPW